MQYQEYLSSKPWKQLRLQALDAYGYRCLTCFRPSDLEVHHTKYPADFDYDKLSNLEVLCRACHEKKHHKTAEETCVHISIVITEVLKQINGAQNGRPAGIRKIMAQNPR